MQILLRIRVTIFAIGSIHLLKVAVQIHFEQELLKSGTIKSTHKMV